MFEGTDLVVMLVVLGLRLFVPLAIPKYPLPAGILCLVIDGLDKGIFQAFTDMNLDWYQGYDKALDVYYLAIAYLATMRNWSNLAAFGMSRFLWYYRLVGVLLFEFSQIRAMLLLFPNTFEYFFLFYEGVRTRWNPKRLGLAAVIGAAFAIWVFIKVPQEYWIHVAQLDFTDTFKEVVLGVPADTGWGVAFGANVPVTVALLALVVVLVILARWLIVAKLPPADWSFTLAADTHGLGVTPEQVLAAQRRAAQRLFDGALVEKVVLVSLITIIFAEVLPAIRAQPLHVAYGVALIIIANTVVSQWLVKHGVEWHSAMREFVVMAVVNLAILGLFSVILPGMSVPLDAPATLFGLALLTLLVTLYDRFRPYYDARRELEGAARAA
ncbi:MAG: hypothetical protein M3Z20_11155 [Chloroflexota bacterium]|nr:hypothetical protein [Chloroflexota bacterium]